MKNITAVKFYIIYILRFQYYVRKAKYGNNA